MALVCEPFLASGSRNSVNLRLLPTPDPNYFTKSPKRSPESENGPSFNDEKVQKTCLGLIRQMASVVAQADSTFSELSTDLEKIMGRSSKLSGRVSQLASFLAKLDPKKPNRKFCLIYFVL